MSHLSSWSTVHDRCDVSGRHVGLDLLGDLTGPKDDSLDQYGPDPRVDEDVKGRPPNFKQREQVRGDHNLVARVLPFISRAELSTHEKHFEFAKLVEAGLDEVPTPITVRFDRDHEGEPGEGTFDRFSIERQTTKGVRRGPRSWGVEGAHSGGLGDDLYVTPVATPATGHRFDRPRDDFGLLDGEFPTHGVVMERTYRRRLDHIEASQVATSRATVSSVHVFEGS